MTQIQASVQVTDKVDSNIERKIENIGNASAKSATQLNYLKTAIKNVNSASLSNITNVFNNLSKTNLSSLQQQMQQLANSSSKLTNNFNSQSSAIVKLQIAQVKLQQEQVKLQIIQQNLQSAISRTNNIQNRGAIGAVNLTNAQTRSATSSVRLSVAQQQLQTAQIRTTMMTNRLNRSLLDQELQGYKSAGSILNLARNLAYLVAGFQTLTSVISVSDAYQGMINKLTLVTDNAEQARNRLSSLTQVALDSYSGLDTTTQLYTRLHLALKQVGGTASEAINITRTLSRATALAGLTTSEANSALLQISQAFNKGKLDGDEFRTVMETMPLLADAIAGRLKVTRGELLKLAPEGKITGEVMKQAVIDMAEVVDARFARLTPTISQELQNLSTTAQVYFGAMFKDGGQANLLSKAIRFLSNNLDVATRSAVLFGVAMSLGGVRSAWLYVASAIATVKKAINGATGAVTILGTAMKATPIGLFVMGAMALVTALDLVSGGAISKTLFPSFEQDQAKAKDYISRLKDIAQAQKEMSYSKLTQESNLQAQAQQQLAKEIAQTKAEMAKYKKAIDDNEKAQAKTKQTIEDLKNSTQNLTAGYSAMSGASVLLATNQNNLIQLNERLTDSKANLSNTERKLEELQKDQVNLYKVELQNLKQRIAVIDNAKEALKGKTDEEIRSNPVLQEQSRILEENASKYGKLQQEVKDLTDFIRGLIGATESLEPALDKVNKYVSNKVSKEAIANIETLTNEYKDLTKLDEKGRNEYKTRKALDERYGSKVAEEDRDKYNNAVSEHLKAKEQYDAKIKAEKEIEDRKKEQERSARRHANEVQRTVEKYENYVAKLNDEHELLSKGLNHYTKYNELYNLRNELAQKGKQISEEQFELLKKQIDANVKLRELAKEIQTIEDDSLAKRKEKLGLKYQAIQDANVSPEDRTIQFDKFMSSNNMTYDVNQGVTEQLEMQKIYEEELKKMKEDRFLDDQQYSDALLSLTSQTEQAIYEKRLANMEAMGGMQAVMATAFRSFEQSASQNIMAVLKGTKSIGQAMRDLASTILNSVLEAIIQMGVKWVAQQAMQLAFGQTAMATQTATSVAMASTLASAWATPASLVSLASYGANAPPAMAGIQATMAITKAMAIAGARQHGGSVNAGDLYQVGEGNAPEIFQSRTGQQYMIAGDNGRVIPNRSAFGGGGGVYITQNVTINGDGKLDPDTLQQMEERTRSIVYEVLTTESRDAGGMLA